MARVLIVDDEKSVRATLGAFVKEDGHEVRTAGDVTEALELLEEHDFDVIVTDIMMPRLSGVELLRKIREASRDIQVVMITGAPTVDTAADALRAGAFDYLLKPIPREAIRKVVANAAKVKALGEETKRLEAENRRYQVHLEELLENRSRALCESEAKYRQVVENSLDGLYIAQGHILKFCNLRFAEMFGYETREELMGEHVRKFIAPGYWELVDTTTKQGESGKEKIAHYELECLRKDGSIFNAEARGSRIIYEGKPAIQGAMRDITERKKTELRIRQEEEKRLNVVINTAHLLHTPLTIIKGNLELVNMGQKEMTPQLIGKLLRKADEMKRRISGELYRKIELMTVETTDGYTPAKRNGK